MEDRPAIEISGTLSLGDVTRFQYFHSLRRSWPVAIMLAALVVLLLPILILGFVISPESDWHQVTTNMLPFLGLLLLWIFLLVGLPRIAAKKQFAAQRYLREPITYSFDPETFSGTGPSAKWSLAWDVVKQVRETKTLFVIYHASNVGVIVPKRFFPSRPVMEEWQNLLTARLEPKQIEKPGFVGRRC